MCSIIIQKQTEARYVEYDACSFCWSISNIFEKNYICKTFTPLVSNTCTNKNKTTTEKHYNFVLPNQITVFLSVISQDIDALT